jgi:hypothetical protein
MLGIDGAPVPISDACTFAITSDSAPKDVSRLRIELTCVLESPEPPVTGVVGADVEGVELWLEPPPPPPPPLE